MFLCEEGVLGLVWVQLSLPRLLGGRVIFGSHARPFWYEWGRVGGVFGLLSVYGVVFGV